MLRAVTPLPNRAIDRTYCDARRNMATYVWTINEAAYPNRKSLDIRKANESELPSLSRPTWDTRCICMARFPVVEIDGERYPALCANPFCSATLPDDRRF